jgi:hypothetical protein
MSSMWIPHRPTKASTKRVLAGGVVLVVLCCVIGPLFLTAVCVAVDRFLGGWLGIAGGVVLAAAAALLLPRARHRRSRDCC